VSDLTLDVNEQINAVRREVGGRVLEAGAARVVTLSRSYPADLDDVWDACTDPERIARWFLPVSGDLKEGGHYQSEGNAGGTITRCDPPHGFDATWEFGGDTSWIELRLRGEGTGRTRFELHHITRADDEKWPRFGPGALGVGWEGALVGLHLHLSTGQPVDAAAMMSWAGSEPGRRFMTEASNGWYDASVAFGTEPAAARAAADRTAAFFTGVPEPDAEADQPH
jgi:uncharacterized protein YndB with AHSA1/START domain